MMLGINGQEVKVEYVRVFRDARNIAFHALVGDEWIYFYKGRNKIIPAYHQMNWPNPNHMYGWSKPYRLNDKKD